jgi:succinate--hydroxymethylglutarate CoA-transferase
VPYEAFPTRDGSVMLGGGNDRLYGVLCERLGRPQWTADPRFATNPLRVQNREVLVAMIGDVTRTKTTQVPPPTQ